MVTVAQLHSEPWWDREVVTPELDWLGDEMCARTGRPRTAAGTKGDRHHLAGAHRSQEWLLRSRFATSRTYTVQGGLTAAQLRHVAGFDFTPGDVEAMLAQSGRLMAAVRAGRLEPVRELYANVDGDRVVDGWDNVRDRAATSDSSHLWHWHLTLDRRRLADRALMERIVAIALGDEEDEMAWQEILTAPDGERATAETWLTNARKAAWWAKPAADAARAAAASSSANQGAIAELAGHVAGLTELVRQTATGPSGPLTPEQLAQLVDRVEAAARAPGERLVAALAAAGEDLAKLDQVPDR